MNCSLKNNRDNTRTNTMWVTCPHNTVITKMFGSCSSYSGRSHQWCVSLTPKNTKTSGRMTCHCFLQHARKGRELPSSSYTACWLFNIYLEQTVNAFMVWESDFMYICVALWKANLQAMITLRYFILLNWIWIAVQSIVTISNVNLIITSVCKIHEKLMHNLIPTK